MPTSANAALLADAARRAAAYLDGLAGLVCRHRSGRWGRRRAARHSLRGSSVSRCRVPRLDVIEQVLLRDAAGEARALDLRKVDTMLDGDLLDDGR